MKVAYAMATPDLSTLVKKDEQGNKEPYFKFKVQESSMNDSYCISLSENESVFQYFKKSRAAFKPVNAKVIQLENKKET